MGPLRAALAIVLLLAAGCQVLNSGDPDAVGRDRARAEADGYAKEITLPPGYDIVRREDYGASTPRENQGGGQLGEARVVFSVSDRPPSQVEKELNDWFVTRGFRISGFTKPKCTDDTVHLAWANDSYLVELFWVRNGVPGRDSVLTVPYSYHGVVSPDGYPAGLPLPTCP